MPEVGSSGKAVFPSMCCMGSSSNTADLSWCLSLFIARYICRISYLWLCNIILQIKIIFTAMTFKYVCSFLQIGSVYPDISCVLAFLQVHNFTDLQILTKPPPYSAIYSISPLPSRIVSSWMPRQDCLCFQPVCSK